MLQNKQFKTPQHVLTVATLLLALAIAAVPGQRAFALITDGEGNDPIPDPGWPTGAAAIFNNPARRRMVGRHARDYPKLRRILQRTMVCRISRRRQNPKRRPGRLRQVGCEEKASHRARRYRKKYLAQLAQQAQLSQSSQ